MKKKSESNYMSVTDDEGDKYKEISEVMTELGYPMVHTSVRNYVLNIMKKFCNEYASEYGITITDAQASEISKRPLFQSLISDVLQSIEFERRRKSK